MGKSGGLGKLPKGQRCQFIIGPTCSWFMPNISDIWTRQKHNSGDTSSLSYYLYGSIGCFCYGEIHRHSMGDEVKICDQPISVLVNNLVDIIEDNSRVSCVRFLKPFIFPLAMILTENGTLVAHDCLRNESIIHFKKHELMKRLVGDLSQFDSINKEHQPNNKRAKFDVTQQINSFVWPTGEDLFVGISLCKLKKIQLHWLKLKDLSQRTNSEVNILKDNIINSSQKLDLNLDRYRGPICCMDSLINEKEICTIAVGMDDGLITVIRANLKENTFEPMIQLERHSDQICSISLHEGDKDRYPMGLIASASRDGLVTLWDVENEFCFADYKGSSGNDSKINWFALKLIASKYSKSIQLLVSNRDNGLSLMDVPEKTKSKVRLKDISEKRKNENLRHHSLIFDLTFDSSTEIVSSASLDGNQIFWTLQQSDSISKNNKKNSSLRLEPRFLVPSMPNNARTHMMRFNPIREESLALALGKAGARFYKLSANPKNRRFDMNHGCSLVCRKLANDSLSPTSLSWNPSHEYRVAIGTIEGRIFRADICNSKLNWVECEKRSQKREPVDDMFGVEYIPSEREPDNPKKVQTNDKDTGFDGVYSLCWGPNPTCPSDPSRLAIYAVGSMTHKLSIYSSKTENEKPSDQLNQDNDLNIPEAINCASEVAWKPSMDLMALGLTNGKIIIAAYSDEPTLPDAKHSFVRMIEIDGPLGITFIQCLSWHPTADREDKCYYYLAASANESPIFIFNLKESILAADVEGRLMIADCPSDGDSLKSNVLKSYVFKLDAHNKAVADISWNPHEPDQLATASFDRTCYVWSLEHEPDPRAKILAKFLARDKLFTVEWSLVDQDLIFSSGQDSTIWAWRPSENVHLESIKLDTM